VVSPTGLVDHPRIWLTPTLLGTLRTRAASGDAAWVALRSVCDRLGNSPVRFPDGTGSTASNAISGGYQYFDYLDPMINLGLCYQVAAGIDATRATAYAAKGRELLLALSDPVHHGRESTDSGWSIRAYGPALALGYDWLYDRLSFTDRTQIYTEINRWVAWFDGNGFGRSHPQGNYFAGYYCAKALGALATEGDNPNAGAMWDDWLNRLHFGLVQPYYAKWLSGGGWPEGWGYGVNGTLNMLRPILAARTAKGLDLLNDAAKPFAFPDGHARWIEHFTWPDRLSVDDRGKLYENDNPTSASPHWTTEYLGLLRAAGGSAAPSMQSYAREIRGTKTAAAWAEFLHWDNAAPETNYKTSRSYRTVGDGQVAMRGAWSTDAAWGAFQSGPYTNYDQSGEEFFDQGALTIKRGGVQFLVNTHGAFMRNSPGTTDSTGWEDFLYNDLYGIEEGFNRPRRTFNVFIAVRSPAYWGQFSYGPGATTTTLSRFEDGGPYVVTRGVNLEKMYMSGTPITGWTREVLFVRPNYFLVYDRTSTNSTSADQWQGFHVMRSPISQPGAAAGTTRYDVIDTSGIYASNPLFRGRVSTLLPAGHSVNVVNVFNSSKIYRFEVRPPASANNTWLTVFDAAASAAQAASAAPLTTANGGVTAGAIEGGYLTYADGSGLAALFSPTGAAPSLPLSFKIPSASANRIVLPDMSANASYNVTATTSGGTTTVQISAGSAFRASADGVLAVQIGAANAVSALTE
jgi:hypothetical protein